jgi:hypothetical protein
VGEVDGISKYRLHWILDVGLPEDACKSKLAMLFTLANMVQVERCTWPDLKPAFDGHTR